MAVYRFNLSRYTDAKAELQFRKRDFLFPNHHLVYDLGFSFFSDQRLYTSMSVTSAGVETVLAQTYA